MARDRRVGKKGQRLRLGDDGQEEEERSLLSSLFSRKRVEQQLTGVHLVPYIKTVIWHLPKFGVLKFCHVQALTWHQYILFVAHSSCSAACTLQGTQGRCMKCTGITVYVLLWFSLCPKKAKLADKDENLGWEMERKTTQAVKALLTSIKEKRVPKAMARPRRYPLHQEKGKKSMGIGRVTSSSPCLVSVMRIG
eukprot:75554-Pelagomonas_calceolata.AAC.1